HRRLARALVVALIALIATGIARADTRPLSWQAYQRNYHFQQLDDRDGLTQNSVLLIFQDKTGFMWFVTQAGLFRYDGYNLTRYTPRSGPGKQPSRGLPGDLAGRCRERGVMGRFHQRWADPVQSGGQPDNPAASGRTAQGNTHHEFVELAWRRRARRQLARRGQVGRWHHQATARGRLD